MKLQNGTTVPVPNNPDLVNIPESVHLPTGLTDTTSTAALQTILSLTHNTKELHSPSPPLNLIACLSGTIWILNFGKPQWPPDWKPSIIQLVDNLKRCYDSEQGDKTYSTKVWPNIHRKEDQNTLTSDAQNKIPPPENCVLKKSKLSDMQDRNSK